MGMKVGEGASGIQRALIVIVMRLPVGVLPFGGTEGNSMGLTLWLGRWVALSSSFSFGFYLFLSSIALPSLLDRARPMIPRIDPSCALTAQTRDRSRNSLGYEPARRCTRRCLPPSRRLGRRYRFCSHHVLSGLFAPDDAFEFLQR